MPASSGLTEAGARSLTRKRERSPHQPPGLRRLLERSFLGPLVTQWPRSGPSLHLGNEVLRARMASLGFKGLRIFAQLMIQNDIVLVPARLGGDQV